MVHMMSEGVSLITEVCVAITLHPMLELRFMNCNPLTCSSHSKDEVELRMLDTIGFKPKHATHGPLGVYVAFPVDDRVSF